MLSLFINLFVAYVISTMFSFILMSFLLNIGVNVVIAAISTFVLSLYTYFVIEAPVAKASDAIASFAIDKYRKVSSFFSNFKDDISMNSFNKKNGLIKLA